MRKILCMVAVVGFVFWARPAPACEFCTIAYMGKEERVPENKHFLAAKIFFEEQDWKEIPAQEAHDLHHDGRHVHDKQKEYVVHLLLTGRLSERFSVDLDIPYVTRRYIEIDAHAHLGENQTSAGLGDITVVGDYRLLQDPKKSFGVLFGLKTPSGAVDERNSFDGLIEPELQPGSGSLDYIAGLTGSWHPATWDLSAGIVYLHKTEGAQDFRFGDVLSVSFFAGRIFDLKDKLQLKLGALMNNQLEQKQNNDDGDVKDSGGYTMLAGPDISLGNDRVLVEFSYLTPAVQNLGGVHQELEGIFTGAVKLQF